MANKLIIKPQIGKNLKKISFSSNVTFIYQKRKKKNKAKT